MAYTAAHRIIRRASVWSSGSSFLNRYARKGSAHEAMTTMVLCAEEVTSNSEPSVIPSSGSMAVGMTISGVGTSICLPGSGSPSHLTDGLNIHSRKVFFGYQLTSCTHLGQRVGSLIVVTLEVVELLTLESGQDVHDGILLSHHLWIDQVEEEVSPSARVSHVR